MEEKQIHSIPPLFDKNSKILILGSFPSVKSREEKFFYSHKQNRFWRLLAYLFNEEIPDSTEAKKTIALRHNVAIWDVIASCSINGSADSSIKDVVPNDLDIIIKNADISHIFLNGKTAQKLYIKYLSNLIDIKYDFLPSTSPANAMYSFQKLIDEWEIIKQYL